MEKTAMKVQRYLMIFGMLALAALRGLRIFGHPAWDRGHPGCRHPSWRNVAGRRHDRSRRNSWRGTTTPTVEPRPQEAPLPRLEPQESERAVCPPGVTPTGRKSRTSPLRNGTESRTSSERAL